MKRYQINFYYEHTCVDGEVVETSKAECLKCNSPKTESAHSVGPLKGNDKISLKGLAKLVTATLLMSCTLGCAVIDAGPRADKKNNANTSNTTFVFQYNNAGQPVAGARVRDNVKIMVQVKDPATGTYYDRQMDAGGWLLVKPQSPLEAVPTKGNQQ